MLHSSITYIQFCCSMIQDFKLLMCKNILIHSSGSVDIPVCRINLMVDLLEAA